MSEKCESCAIGTYQAKEGQLTCLVCPRNTSTTSDNTKTIKECKGKCFDKLMEAEFDKLNELEMVVWNRRSEILNQFVILSQKYKDRNQGNDKHSIK